MTSLRDEVEAATEAVRTNVRTDDWSMTLTADAAEVSTGPLEAQVTDWYHILSHFGLDPEAFEVIDDTVKMSSWQQSKRTDSGDRDIVWLYAYKARFRRITDRLPEVDVQALRDEVKRWRPVKRRAPAAKLGAPSTFYVGLADWQIGKGEGGGSVGTAQRVLDTYDQAITRVKELRRIGRNVTSLAMWNMGDPVEGTCEGNYASQTYTVDRSRREQLLLALDLWKAGLRALAPLFDDVEFGTVLCNHGEWTRVAGKPVTGDSDNAGAFLADALQRVLADRPDFDHVRFTIPHDQMTMVTEMSGVPVALCHGHKAPGSAAEAAWMQAQATRVLRESRVEPRLWMTAHRHHYSIIDHGPWTRIQHPSLDYGSKWFADTAGKWSSPGTFTCLVGEHDQAGGPMTSLTATGFSDESVLTVR